MRLRTCVLACALTLLGGLTAAGTVSAAPQHNQGLTIAATPNPVIAGDGVLIYGRLLGPGSGDQTIRLYHHIIGRRQGYGPVAVTHTDGAGYYEFIRPEGLVYTNRNWFVRGPDGAHSRTVHERVIALVSISPTTTRTDTNHAVVFSGHVTPNHRFEQVFLQQQIGSSDEWRTLRSTTLDPRSSYFVAYRWRRPGVHDIRVLFKGDARSVRSASDIVTIDVEQAQARGFTIDSSIPIVPDGGSVTIFGTLDRPGTTKPQPNAVVQLWGRTPDHRFQVLADQVTRADGSYSFNQSGLTTNMIYYVATMPGTQPRHERTARLYQGVRDLVTMQASTNSATSAQTVTITGMVLPDKSGRTIALQLLGTDGDWHTVELAVVRQDSTFQFTWPAGSPGTNTLRARITSDEDNIGSASAPVSIATTAPPASALPPAS
jgi:hypothetical protein